jgi:hypothetical protein
MWTGQRSAGGYGYMSISGRDTAVHRWVYERFVGPIPERFDIDHLCRNHACVNHVHLEPVPHRVNTLRGESPCAQFARRDACGNGHEYTPENTFTRRDNSRGCRTCDRARSRAGHQRRLAIRQEVAVA